MVTQDYNFQTNQYVNELKASTMGISDADNTILKSKLPHLIQFEYFIAKY